MIQGRKETLNCVCVCVCVCGGGVIQIVVDILTFLMVLVKIMIIHTKDVQK